MDFKLFLISDRKVVPATSARKTLSNILHAGLGAFQLREKDLTDRKFYEMALETRALTQRYGCKLIINSRFDIAKAVGADGVHLPENSLSIAVVRHACGRRTLIGKSTHTVEAAIKAEKEEADYITFGPVFPTPSKAVYGPPVGLDALRRTCAEISIPVFAIGGITLAHVDAVLAHGAYGVALISAVWRVEDPAAAVAEFLKMLGA